MLRTAALVACVSTPGCASSGKPTDDLCLAAAANMIELFAPEDAGQDSRGRRMAEAQHRSFFASCRDTGTIEQATCASRAATLAELEQCR